MKLAFSTLGCPDFDWSDIYSLAKDFGFDGIELRGLGDQIFSIHAKPFQEDALPKTVEYLNRMHWDAVLNIERMRRVPCRNYWNISSWRQSSIRRTSGY